MKIEITEEWLRKRLEIDGDEPGGLMACSPELYEKILMKHQHDTEAKSLLEVMDAEMQRKFLEMNDRFMGKKVRFHIDSIGFNKHESERIYLIRSIMWSHTQGWMFCVNGKHSTVWYGPTDFIFLAE